MFVLLGVQPAKALTDEIQVYDAAIAPPGTWNLMLHNNFTPDKNKSPEFPGDIVPDRSLNALLT